MKNIIIAVVVVAALAYALSTYDISKDPTFHNCTATCAQQGCTFE
jgi:hypothetical protein